MAEPNRAQPWGLRTIDMVAVFRPARPRAKANKILKILKYLESAPGLD